MTSANLEKRQALIPTWVYAIAAALLPLLVLWHRDDVLYSPPLHTDPWFYLGYFRTLVDFKRDFAPGFHAGSRYSWILPGYLIHSVFSPLAANAVLHLTVHSVAVLSLFSILRTSIGLRSAFLSAMLFSLHPWLWAATGWDYVDGAGIAYCLLALALLNRSVRTQKPASLVLAGVTVALMLFTNLSLITNAALLLLYFFAAVWIRRGFDRRTMLAASSLLALGFAAVTLLFCAINYWLDGTFWFLGPAIATARDYAANWRWPASIWENGTLGPWLWFSVAAAGAAVVLLPLRVKRRSLEQHKAALLFSAQFALALSAMAYLQYRGPAVLGQYFYASQLLPFTFLVIGSSFFQSADAMSQRAYLGICAGAALLFGAIWYRPDKWPLPNHAAIVAAGVTLTMALLWRRRKFAVPLSLAGFLLLTGAMANRAVRLHGSRAQYQRVMNMRAKIESRRDGNLVRFWFDQRDPNVPDYMALNSTYFAEFSRLGSHFPQYGCESRLEAGTLVVVSSSSTEHPEEAASGPLANCWRPFGMKPVSEEVDRYQPSGLPAYTVSLIRAQADPSLRHSLLPVFDSSGNGVLEPAATSAPTFPLERWNTLRNPSGQGQMRVAGGGIEVRTPRSAYATALSYAPLIASVTGRYRFALQYDDRSGHFAFGARSADDSRYLAEDSSGYRSGKVREMVFWIDLTKGDRILLRIANNNNDGPGAASFRIQKLSAVEVDPVEGAPPLQSQ